MSEFKEPAPYDYEDGLRDRCVNDPLWAADEIEWLRERLGNVEQGFDIQVGMLSAALELMNRKDEENEQLRKDIHALTHRPAPTYYGYR